MQLYWLQLQLSGVCNSKGFQVFQLDWKTPKNKRYDCTARFLRAISFWKYCRKTPFEASRAVLWSLKNQTCPRHWLYDEHYVTVCFWYYMAASEALSKFLDLPFAFSPFRPLFFIFMSPLFAAHSLGFMLMWKVSTKTSQIVKLLETKYGWFIAERNLYSSQL